MTEMNASYRQGRTVFQAVLLLTQVGDIRDPCER